MNDNPIPGLAALKPVAPKGPTCADCRFMIVDDKQFVCRRNPPQATVVMVPRPMPPQMIGGKVQQQMGMAPQTLSAWPLVMKDWWCGAYEAAFSKEAMTEGPTLSEWFGNRVSPLLPGEVRNQVGEMKAVNMDKRVPGDDPT